MIGSNLLKHAKEFCRYVRNYQYETSAQGIFFPKANATIGGVYSHWITGYESEIQHDANLIPNQGLAYILDNILITAAADLKTNWYVGLASNTAEPDAATTHALWTGNYTEITTGFTNNSLVQRAPFDVTDGVDTADYSITNDTVPATFDFTASHTIWGAAVMSTQTVGSNSASEILLSHAKFASSRDVVNTDQFNLRYKLDIDAT